MHRALSSSIIRNSAASSLLSALSVLIFGRCPYRKFIAASTEFEVPVLNCTSPGRQRKRFNKLVRCKDIQWQKIFWNPSWSHFSVSQGIVTYKTPKILSPIRSWYIKYTFNFNDRNLLKNQPAVVQMTKKKKKKNKKKKKKTNKQTTTAQRLGFVQINLMIEIDVPPTEWFPAVLRSFLTHIVCELGEYSTSLDDRCKKY